MNKQNGVDSKVREIRRKTRKRYSAEEKIRIVLEGIRGEERIASLCRREGIRRHLFHFQWMRSS
jgi:transposase